MEKYLSTIHKPPFSKEAIPANGPSSESRLSVVKENDFIAEIFSSKPINLTRWRFVINVFFASLKIHRPQAGVCPVAPPTAEDRLIFRDKEMGFRCVHASILQ